MMKKNMGGADRTIRVILALGVGALYYFNVITGTLAYVLLAFAAIFVLTSFVGFCPLYTLFGINSCKVKD
ncbi:YgaP family membrane protein [Flagellimonas halotolerans]